jgi:hypothetical protein
MANINDGLSTYHLSTGTHRAYQPGKGNFFEFIIEGLDELNDGKGLLKPGVEADLADDSDYISNAQEVIRLTVNKAPVPHYELGDLEIRKGNSVVHYAGVPTFSDGTLEVDDMIGAQSKAVLEAWQNLAYDVLSDKGGRAINYKKNATLIEYTSDHVRVRSWKLIGCWIKNIEEGDYDKESDDIRRISATIRYDRAIPVIENV